MLNCGGGVILFDCKYANNKMLPVGKRLTEN